MAKILRGEWLDEDILELQEDFMELSRQFEDTLEKDDFPNDDARFYAHRALTALNVVMGGLEFLFDSYVSFNGEYDDETPGPRFLH